MLFEALVLTFAQATGVAKVAAMTREHDTRIWRVLEHHLHAARDRADFSGVRKVGMDETSAAKGQDYVSIFADLAAGRVLFATEGPSADTVAAFAADLAEHGGDPERVSDTSSDMSTASIAGIGEHLPNARMTFDRYHLAAKLSEAVDQVRRTEVTTRPELKHTRWLWLKNWSNLSRTQRRELHRLVRPSAQLATTRALRWREDFQAFYDQDPSLCARLPAPLVLRRQTQPPPNRSRTSSPSSSATATPVLAWHANHLTNGLLEGINSLVQAAKARARGYRNKDKMITIVYLIAAKLPLPTVTNPAPVYMA